jgi:multidrug efflux pump subunit AcrA (membrane-fusion protein)
MYLIAGTKTMQHFSQPTRVRFTIRRVARFVLAAVATICLTSGVAPPQRANAQHKTVISTECLLLKLDQASVAAKRDGIVEKVYVRRGDEIAAEDPLFDQSQEEAKARHAAATAALERAKTRAGNLGPIRVAEAELKKSTKEDALLREAGRTPFLEQFRAAMSVERNSAELRAARATHAEHQLDVQVKRAEEQLAKMDVMDRNILSPITGTIVKQYRFAGEWVRKGDPVVKILRMDELMLQSIVNTRNIAPHKISGATMQAEFELAGEPPFVLDGLVVLKASPEVDLDGNYGIWAHIHNVRRSDLRGESQWMLRPGLTGKLRIEISDANGVSQQQTVSK